MEATSEMLSIFVVDRIAQSRVLVRSGTIEEAISASRQIASSDWVPGHSDLVEVFPVDPALCADVIAFQDLYGPRGEQIEPPIESATEFACDGLPQAAIHRVPILRLVSRIVRGGYQPDGKRSKVAWLHTLADYATCELRLLLVEEVVAAIRRGAAQVAPGARFAIIAEGSGGSHFAARPILVSGSYFPPLDSDGWRGWNQDALDWPDILPPLEPWILHELATQYASSCEALLVDLLNKRIESFY